jgi:hypothetical protein
MVLNLEDPRWSTLRGGHRLIYDPRPPLRNLDSGVDVEPAWNELWENLYHQDDVGEASYACVPELVRIYKARPTDDWRTFAIVASIEAVRETPRSPPVPDWIEAEYREALTALFALAVQRLEAAEGDELVRSLIALIALAKGQRSIAQIAFLTEDERQEFLDQ